MRVNAQAIELGYKQTDLIIFENQCIINVRHKIFVTFQKCKFHHFKSKRGIFDAAGLCVSANWKASVLPRCCNGPENELHHFQTELLKLCK